MSEQKDPAIKLFGMTIPVAEPPPIYAGGGGGCSLEASSCSTTTALVEENMNMNMNMNMNSKNISCSNMDRDEGNSNKDGEEDEPEVRDQHQGDDDDKETKEEPQPEVSSEEPRNSDAASGVSSNLKTSSVEENSGTPKADEEQSEGSNSQEKTTLKKPDKILPCPRCNSMDTKFCYYNNYNVNQPRHFCKNCQRYWTAGGTMRNVPVGAGRRKNKNSSSSASPAVAVQYRHVAEATLTPKPNGTVLSFGSDTPLCESMASVLSLGDRNMRNGFCKPEELTIPIAGEATSLPAEDEPPQDQQAVPSFVPPIPCFPAGAPWPYQWSPQAAAFCPPGFPMPFYPAAAAYWGWNVPWLPPQPPNSGNGGLSSGPNSPTLGKHSRDESIASARPSSWEGEPSPMPRERCSERSLWIPKTLRIDDPGEAARSSIWATLGIKKDKPDSISGTGLFKSFQSKNDQRNPIQETSTKVLQANPAALSRSVSFQERS